MPGDRAVTGTRKATAEEYKKAASLARRISRDLHKRTDAEIRVSVNAVLVEKDRISLTVAFPPHDCEAAVAAVESWGSENPRAKVWDVEGGTYIDITIPYTANA